MVAPGYSPLATRVRSNLTPHTGLHPSVSSMLTKAEMGSARDSSAGISEW